MRTHARNSRSRGPKSNTSPTATATELPPTRWSGFQAIAAAQMIPPWNWSPLVELFDREGRWHGGERLIPDFHSLRGRFEWDLWFAHRGWHSAEQKRRRWLRDYGECKARLLGVLDVGARRLAGRWLCWWWSAQRNELLSALARRWPNLLWREQLYGPPNSMHRIALLMLGPWTGAILYKTLPPCVAPTYDVEYRPDGGHATGRPGRTVATVGAALDLLVMCRSCARARTRIRRPPLSARPLARGVRALVDKHHWNTRDALACVSWWVRFEIGWAVSRRRADAAIKRALARIDSDVRCTIGTEREVETIPVGDSKRKSLLNSRAVVMEPPDWDLTESVT